MKGIQMSLLAVLFLACLALHVEAKGGKKASVSDGESFSMSKNYCESTEELRKCREACNADRDCKDETNLNCSLKCKQACWHLDRSFGARKSQCKQILLRTIIYDRNPELIPENK